VTYGPAARGGGTWIDDMRQQPIPRVARELGLRIAAARGANGGALVGCPACGAQRRHASRGDRRGAVGVRRDGLGARCFACGTGFDSLDLVAFHLGGARLRDLPVHRRIEVREWCQRRASGGYSALPLAVEPTEPPPRPSTIVERTSEYPPHEEVNVLWCACSRVDVDPEANAYLQSRGLDATCIADRDLARVLAASGLPRWACSWAATHKIVVPLFDADGVMRSLLARSIDRNSPRKSLAPSGFARSGLIMSDLLGRQLLQRGAAPEWWLDDRELRVVVAEGEIDVLVWATWFSEADEHAPAVFGLVSGSWTDEIAMRVPSDATVVIATDNDAAGDKYANRVAETLDNRAVHLERWHAARSA
jgi:Toprim-like